MSMPLSTVPAVRAPSGAAILPSERQSLLLIARRAALEALRDRITLLVSGFFSLVFPLIMVFSVVRPLAGSSGSDTGVLGTVLAVYLLLIGLLPTTAAIGVACGQFAGEKEQGNLAPLLASPASNVAIFGGKVLGAVLPAILFAIVAECSYLIAVSATIGADKLRLLPAALAIAMLLLVPAVATFAATVASLISSRVRTFNTAQQISSILLFPLWGILFGVAFKMGAWGAWTLALAVVAVFAIDAVLTVVAAKTWRREEVLAQQ